MPAEVAFRHLSWSGVLSSAARQITTHIAHSLPQPSPSFPASSLSAIFPPPQPPLSLTSSLSPAPPLSPAFPLLSFPLSPFPLHSSLLASLPPTYLPLYPHPSPPSRLPPPRPSLSTPPPSTTSAVASCNRSFRCFVRRLAYLGVLPVCTLEALVVSYTLPVAFL